MQKVPFCTSFARLLLHVPLPVDTAFREVSEVHFRGICTVLDLKPGKFLFSSCIFARVSAPTLLVSLGFLVLSTLYPLSGVSFFTVFVLPIFPWGRLSCTKAGAVADQWIICETRSTIAPSPLPPQQKWLVWVGNIYT